MPRCNYQCSSHRETRVLHHLGRVLWGMLTHTQAFSQREVSDVPMAKVRPWRKASSKRTTSPALRSNRASKRSGQFHGSVFRDWDDSLVGYRDETCIE